MNPAEPRAGLNEQQRAVVRRTSGDTFVSAGAGSGKTRVLAERFAALVLAEPAGPAQGEALRRVLLITFTDKAAGELGERVRHVLLEQGRADLARLVDDAWISTIHGFCSRVVRRHALELGVDPGFAVLAEPQAGVVRQQAFEEAAVALAAADPEVSEILEAHGVAAVRRAVALGLDQVRAMGRTVDELVVPRTPDCGTALRRGAEELGDVAAAYGALPSLALVEHNLRVLTELLRDVRSLEAVPPADLAMELVALSDAFRLRRPGNAKDPVKRLTLDAIGCLDTLVRVGTEAVSAVHTSAYARLMGAYARVYETRKAALDALDFEDLQLLSARLFEECPNVARRYADRFLDTMVDEFQDTNELQMRVVTPIARSGLCVVGDAKQSIYGFRFADVAVFQSVGESQRAADPDGCCPLQLNYRSHPALLETFNAMFGAEPFFPGGYLDLQPGRTGGWTVDVGPGTPRTEVILVDRSGWEGLTWRDAEARTVARRVKQLVEAGVAQCDIAVLLRQMTAARTYVLALRAQGLTVHADSAGGFFSAPEVADVRALLSTLANPRDEEALIGLLAGGLGGLSDDALYLLTRPAEASGRGGAWAVLGSADQLGLDAGDASRCVLVHDTIQRLRAQTGRMRLADIMLDAVAALGPGGGCLSRDGAWANLRKAARLAAEFERVAQADPAAFLRHLEEREAFVKREASADVAAEGSGAIRVMTVHAAKGLEFPVVVVADLGHEGRRATETLVVVKDGKRPVAAARLPRSFGEDLPLPRPFEEARDAEALRAREEEKRVLYVACTRAEEMLVLAGGAKLDKEPGERLAVDWVRTAIGDPCDPALPGVAVTVVVAERDGANVASLPGAPSGAPVGHARHAAASGRRRAAVSREAPVPPTDLSYTALVLYERCPYRFFAERVLGVGSLERDDEGGGPRGLGLAVHAALQLRAMGREPDASRLDALARHHRLDADGRSRVARALDAAAASSAAGLAGSPEVRFAVSVEGGTLVGTLDLLVQDGARALVIDYKTGAAALGRDDARERFRKQADIYALALLRSGSAAVEVRFIEVERDGRETRFTYDAAQTEVLEARIADVFAGIAAGRFPRLPAFDHDICSHCPVSGGLCPVVRPKARAKRVR